MSSDTVSEYIDLTYLRKMAKFFCIQCGHGPVNSLYKTYAKGTLVKLIDCESCGEHIDKFIEYDPILVVVSLVLLNESAFRHILFNTDFQIYKKVGIVFLLFEVYCHWFIAKGIAEQFNPTEVYELETNFYRSLFRCIFGTGLFHLTLLLLTSIWLIRELFKRPAQFSYKVLWKGVILCSYAQSFQLITLIWSDQISGPRMDFSSVLLLISNSQCYKVVTGAPKVLACFTVLISYTLQILLYHYFDIFVPVVLSSPSDNSNVNNDS